MTRTLRFPATILIGPHHYDLDISQAGINEERVLCGAGADLIGHIRYATNAIKIDPTLHPDRLLEVVLHESLHGICHSAGFSPDNEEEITTILAQGLLRFFRDNPALMKVLCKEVV